MLLIILFLIGFYGQGLYGGTPEEIPDFGIEPGTRINNVQYK